MENNNNPRFEYCFYLTPQSKRVLEYSLPIILFDACHTTGSYKGMIFLAYVVTSANITHYFAIGIAPSEKYNYWKKFIVGLNEALNLISIENLVVISDREKGIALALSEVVTTANHSYCVYHIEKKYQMSL